MKIGKIQRNLRNLPLIPVAEFVVFPHVVAPLRIRDEESIKALKEVLTKDRNIFFAFQKQSDMKSSFDDFHPIGVVAHVHHLVKTSQGEMRLLAEGQTRAKLVDVTHKGELRASFKVVTEEKVISEESSLLMEKIRTAYKVYVANVRKVPREVVNTVLRSDTPEKLIGNICMSIQTAYLEKIEIISGNSQLERLKTLSKVLDVANEAGYLKADIHSRVRTKMEKTHKEFFLNEQLKEIKKELDTVKDTEGDDTESFESKLKALHYPDEVRQKGLKEAGRLSKLQPITPEAGILRVYLEWLTELPWNIYSEDGVDLKKARKRLDSDHYNLQEAKERILDFIAIQQLQKGLKGPILCLVGPPGTGKTSLGRSISGAINRKFERISLGGVRDEAEIRGHRKTYVGALPGKIIQAIKKTGTSNPVILLDEIDKISSDYKGDPASALLEVLDPEQNSTFKDHYLELEYDLSRVMFITTANSVHNIPGPLLDRMELIEVPGYTEYEKIQIARRFVMPRQLKENGVNDLVLNIDDNVLAFLVRNYTAESGVRSLDREIGKMIRKIAREFITTHQNRGGRHVFNSSFFHKYGACSGFYEIDDSMPTFEGIEVSVDKDRLKELLGREKRNENDLNKVQSPGFAIGMAWTEVGGRILPVEAAILEGGGKLILTGKLGDVMKESAQIALSFIKANTKEFKLDKDFYKEKDIHIHVPEGAIPKDGPSAGITMTAAILSAVRKQAILPIAMTGEITLTDRLLPIGGLREKILAAHRYGIKAAILPGKNSADIEDLPDEVKEAMTFHFCDSVKEAIKILFPEE